MNKLGLVKMQFGMMRRKKRRRREREKRENLYPLRWNVADGA